MVPVAKAAVLLVLLGGATVSTYAVANGGFGDKAKSSEESEEAKETDANKNSAPTTDQDGGTKDTVPPVEPGSTKTTELQEGDTSDRSAQRSTTPEPTTQKPGGAESTEEKSSKGGSDVQPASASGPSVTHTT